MSLENTTSVVSLLSVILSNDSNMQKCEIKLNSRTTKFLKELLKNSPDDLEIFQKLFNDITEDGKIDINDVPKILELLKTIYNMTLNYKKFKLTVEDVENLTKFILTELATVKGVNKNTINQILLIVDSASNMLTIVGVNKKSVVNLGDFFKKMF